MIDGKLLVTTKWDAMTGGLPYDLWGVWMPRQGDNLVLATEVVVNNFTDFTMELFQKNYDEAGNGSSAGESTEFVGVVGRQVLTKLGVKELVRVKLTVARNGDLSPDLIGHVLFRFLQPVWFESVRG